MLEAITSKTSNGELYRCAKPLKISFYMARHAFRAFHSHALPSLFLPFRISCTSLTVLHVAQSAERLITTVVTPDQSKMKDKSLIWRRQYCKCEERDLTFLKYLFSEIKLFLLSPTQKGLLYWLLFQFGLSSSVRPICVCSNRQSMMYKVRSPSWREQFLHLKDFLERILEAQRLVLSTSHYNLAGIWFSSTLKISQSCLLKIKGDL